MMTEGEVRELFQTLQANNSKETNPMRVAMWSGGMSAAPDGSWGGRRMSIIDFLEARIAEDEVRATMRDWHTADCQTIPNDAGYSYPCDCGVPERLAAECTAKRAIIAEHGIDDSATGDWCETCAAWWDYTLGEGPPAVQHPCPTLKALAAVYKDHPDYQQEWA